MGERPLEQAEVLGLVAEPVADEQRRRHSFRVARVPLPMRLRAAR